MKMLTKSIILALTLTIAAGAYAIPYGFVKCKHFDGTTVIIQANSCQSLGPGWLRVFS